MSIRELSTAEFSAEVLDASVPVLFDTGMGVSMAKKPLF